MTIELKLISEIQSHQKLLSSLIANSEVSILCSGWLKIEGLRLLAPAFNKALSKNHSVSIISNFAHTHKRAATLIGTWSNVHHYMKQDARTLHSKVYYFRTGCEFTAIVGSANVTQAGLMSSDEASLRVTGTVGDDFHAKIMSYLEGMQSHRE